MVQKILILAANPKTTQPLELDLEIREIESGLRRSLNREQFVIEKHLAVRTEDLRRTLLDVEPRFVHFCGHGMGDEGILLEDIVGYPQLVKAEPLANLFKLFSDRIECVILNACYSEVQAQALAEHINYVIGMRQGVGDRTAINFAVGFYDAIGAGRTIEEAFEFGKNAIELNSLSEERVPVLLLKKKTGVEFVVTSMGTGTSTLENSRSMLSLSHYDPATWVGRDSLITALTQKLQEGCRILALTGITGIGKTVLAERLVVEVHENGAQFHRLNFDDRGQGRDFISGALSLLPKLGEMVTIEDQKDPQNALKHLLQTLRKNRFLVQIDSMEMLLQGDEHSGWNAFVDPLWVEFIHQLLAGEDCQSQLLLTSQALSEELEVEGSCYPRLWHRQNLAGLSEEEQLQLFEKNGLMPDELETETLQRIGKLYEGHPLVIQVIAKDILNKPFNGNIQQYWQHYQAEFDEIERECKEGRSPKALQLMVKQRVEKSLKRLPSDAYQMLCRSFIYRRPVPKKFWVAMLADLSEDKQRAAMELLKSHNLAEEEFRTDRVLLLRQHNLVRSVARSLLRTDEAVWREVERKAAHVWLNDYKLEPDTPNLEKLRGALEAFHHYCEVEDWEVAKEILIDREVGTQLQTWGYFRELLSLYERVLGKLDATVDVVCERCIGIAYWFLSNYPQAIDHCQQSLVTAREVGDRQGEGLVLSSLGLAYHFLDNYPKAIDHHEQGLIIVREIGDRKGEERALGNLGHVYQSLGNYYKALEYYQQQLTIAREIGARQGEGKALGSMGNAYESLGDYPKAIDHHEQCLTIVREIGDRQGEGKTWGNLGRVYQFLGNYYKALEYYQQELTIAREIGDREGEGGSLVNRGATLIKLEQYSEAQQHLQTSLEIFRKLGIRRGEAEVLLKLGELYHKTGQSEARKFCDGALAIASELGIPLVKECEEFQAMLAAEETL